MNLSTILASLPGLRRLRGAIRDINALLRHLQAEQGLLRQELARQAALLQPAPPPPAASPPAAPPPDAAAADTAALDRQMARGFQQAALRHLPLLPGAVTVADRFIAFEGFAGAAEDLTEAMAFFVNGQPCSHAEYPRPAEDFARILAQVPGGGYAVRARLRADPLALAGEDGFLRLDAAPTGTHVPGDWRRALHVLHPARERFPLPPGQDWQPGAGSARTQPFHLGGATLFRHIGTLLGELGRGWETRPAVLEWGCGHGRLSRYLIGHSEASVTAVDPDAAAIAWCRANLPGGRFEILPAALPPGSFDLIVAVAASVPVEAAAQAAWLGELRALLRPGGLLLLPARGPVHCAYSSFPPRLFRAAEASGGVESATDGALISRRHITEAWGRQFEVLAIEDAIAAMQDMVVLRRRGDEAQAAHEAAGRRLMALPVLAAASTLEGAAADGGSGAYWSVAPAQQAEAVGWYWMAHPMVQARINALVSGDPARDAYDRLAELWQAGGGSLPIGRVLSIGCGFGGLERDLAARGIARRIEAFDPAEGAIAEARRLAAGAGFADLHYHVGDLESLDFVDGSFDVVLAHQSVHHVERLEPLYRHVWRVLKPGGLFHLSEYVGPDRFQWTDAQIEQVNDVLDSLPPRLRRTPTGLKPPQERPTLAAMIAADPTEAVRSAAILPLLRRHFTVVEERPFGGALLHLALANIAQNFPPEQPAAAALLRQLFALEDRLMAEGVVGSDFAVVTARKDAAARDAGV